ncbi:MAG: hypothetical protein SWY16_02595 [Cyanobacteriota bacterium]|nr:hypothetical protein [Cyanobacteriota bacterium]
MLVIVTDDRIVPTCQVCQNCLLADRRGQPRWKHGQLGCAHSVQEDRGDRGDRYECEMGFLVVNIE